jgi:Ca2+-binding EF-hand superfamily protein
MSFARPKYPHPRSIDHLLFDAGSVYLHGFEEATKLRRSVSAAAGLSQLHVPARELRTPGLKPHRLSGLMASPAFYHPSREQIGRIERAAIINAAIRDVHREFTFASPKPLQGHHRHLALPPSISSGALQRTTMTKAALPPIAAEEMMAKANYEPAGPTRQELAARAKQKVKSTQFVQSASNALNSRFSDMFKAFQYVDLDRSGTLDKKEIARALDLWNIPIDHDKLDDLIAACDADGDGQVSYKEFVDVLARDTVANAAMGKRGMQAQEAMGVADLDPEFLGHKKIKNVRASLNNLNFD